jgi:penicillin-binding protein 1A
LRAASLHYFSRQPEKLNPGEAAMLAGLVQAPSRLAPTRSYPLASQRMQLVLRAMVASGYLTAKEAGAISPPGLHVRSGSVLPTGTYFADWALPEARKLSDVGYARETITTTLDARLQAAARRAVRLAPPAAQVALVAMRRNGEVVAMVGGTDYAASPFNRATQARRQPGSTFKLFVYLAALRGGWKPSDIIDNRPITAGSYRPKNFSEKYSESMTLEDAFAQSSNVAAVRLWGKVGDRKVIAAARELGVTSPLAEGDPSLALGTSSMTLLELTAAYAGIAANNYPVVPRPFPVEEQSWLQRAFDGKGSLSSSVHNDIEQLLRRAVSSGTGRAARLGLPSYGKTGTSQDNRDALFVGYSGDLVVGVWIGNDDNSPLVGITGGGLPARIWRDFMLQALGKRGRPERRANPRGQVQPQDLDDAGRQPADETPRLRIDGSGAVLSGNIGGVPIELNVNGNGWAVDTKEVREQAGEALQRAREQQQKATDAAGRALENARERLNEANQRYRNELSEQQPPE